MQLRFTNITIRYEMDEIYVHRSKVDERASLIWRAAPKTENKLTPHGTDGRLFTTDVCRGRGATGFRGQLTPTFTSTQSTCGV